MHNLLELTLFGSPEVRLHGLLVTGFCTSKAQALLYYLAVSGRAHTRPTLAGLLWGDQPEVAARVSLSKCLSNLRDLVGDAVLIERQTIVFNRNHPYQLDTERFAASVGTPPTPATIQAWQAALALYRGDFLEGFYVRDAPDFEQWLLIQRAYYREMVVQGLHTLATFADQQGDLQAAIAHTRHLLALEPWREEAHRQLMVLLARSGQRAAALAQFETCRLILDEELTVEPDAATLALYEQIKVNDLQPKQVPASASHFVNRQSEIVNSLPIPATPLIGRTRELSELTHLLANPACRLLTIVGAGGIGKTRLAIDAAATQAQGFADQVAFVALAALIAPEFMTQAIAGALDFTFSGLLPPKQQLLTYLHPKAMLLVLDNIEHLLAPFQASDEGLNLLVEMLQQAPRLKLLITSRERLNIQSEWVFELQGLPIPTLALSSGNRHTAQPEATTQLERNESVTLFVHCARRVQHGFGLSAQNQQYVAQICRLVEGMPLGIELAAVWVPSLSCGEIAQEIERNIDFLAATQHDIPPRHRSLRATFDYSWKLLNGAEQRVMNQLSIFRGGFTREAAAAITGASLPMLAGLMAKSLLRRDAQGRYDLHELVRQYAAMQLLQDAELAAKTAEKHGQYYLRWLVQQDLALKGARQPEIVAEVNRVIDNLRLAWRWAIMQRSSAAVEPVIPVLWWYYELRRIFHEPIAMLQEGVDRFQPGAATDEASLITYARLLGLLGYFHLRVGNLNAARSEITRSLTLLRPFPATGAFADVLIQGGVIFHTSGEFDRGVTLLQEALVIHEQRKDSWLMAACYFFLGNAMLIEGRFGEAVDYLSQSLQLVRALGDRFTQSGVLAFLSAATLGRGQPTQARQSAEEALRFTQQTGDRWASAQALNVLGLVAHGEQNYQDAHRLLKESAAIYEQLGEAWSLSRVTFNLGKTLLAAGEEQAARRILLRSLQVAHAAQILPDVLNVLVTLAGEAASTTPTSDSYRWAALVAHHPASTAEARTQAEELCRSLATSPAPQILPTLGDPVQASPLDDIVMELLAQVQ